MTPIITVLMAVYNSQKYIKESIDSILTQTFENFEFIIIDDCSTDSTLKIIESYRDPRIRLIKNSVNLGLTKSLNIGLKNARGKYIARLDGDDISLNNRLEEQLHHMEKSPETTLIGTWAECIDKDGHLIKISRHQTDPIPLKFDLIFENSFIHSSIFFKKDTILKYGGYNEKYRHAQDFELYSRIVQDCKIYNIPIILTKLRIHNESVVAHTSTKNTVHNNALSIIRDNIRRYIPITDKNFTLLTNTMILKKPWGHNSLWKTFLSLLILKQIYTQYKNKTLLTSKDMKKIKIRYRSRQAMIFKLYIFSFYKNAS